MYLHFNTHGAITMIVVIMLIVAGCGDEMDTPTPMLPTVSVGSDDFYAGAPELPFGHGPRVSVRVYYLEPDSQPIPPTEADFAEYAVLIDELVKKAQRFFADEMKRHGYGKKTFPFHKDATHRVSITRITLKESANYYETHGWNEIERELVDMINADRYDGDGELFPRRSINVFFIDVPGVRGCGLGAGTSSWGEVFVFGGCWTWDVLAHELGHAMGLHHDYRDDSFIMSYGQHQDKLSPGAAGWLNRHSAFNVGNRVLVSFFSLTDIHVNLLEMKKIGQSNTYRFTFDVRFPYYPDGTYSKDYIFDYAVLKDSRAWQVLNFSDDVRHEIIRERKLTDRGPVVKLEMKHEVIVKAELLDETTHVGLELIGPNSHILSPIYEHANIPIER